MSNLFHMLLSACIPKARVGGRLHAPSQLAACLLLVIAGSSAQAALIENWSFTGASSQIPDGEPTGVSQILSITTSAITEIQSVSVSLDISSGFNGDLYGYLRHGSGFSILLNRVGRTATTGAAGAGYGDNGFDVTFMDSASNGDIHNYQSLGIPAPGSPLTGTWQPDGRNADPDAAVVSERSAMLGSLVGLDANGDWTLFVADMNRGGGVATLSGWDLTITGVPEVVNPALAIFGAVLSLVHVLRSRRFRGWLHKRRSTAR